MLLHKITTSIFALLLVFSINSNATPFSAVNGTSFSGEEIFQGVYFGSGKVAAHIPSAKGINIATFTSDKTKIAAANKFQQELIGKIKASNPTFFKEFGQMMNSRKHLQVQAGLEMGAAEITRVLQSDAKFQELANSHDFRGLQNELASKLKDDASPKEANAVVSKYIEGLPTYNEDEMAREACLAAAVAVVVAGAVAIVIWKWAWVYSESQIYLNSDLLKEEIVDSVVNLPY